MHERLFRNNSSTLGSTPARLRCRPNSHLHPTGRRPPWRLRECARGYAAHQRGGFSRADGERLAGIVKKPAIGDSLHLLALYGLSLRLSILVFSL